MLSNMASSLILKKRIKTTVAKAKALRQYVEPLITKAKNDTTHSRRVVFSYLQNKYSVKELFGDVAMKIGERPGGYTRILKTGNRLGDNAEMCIIELVDYNENLLKTAQPAKSKTRRGRSKKKSSDTGEQQPAATAATEEVVEEAVVESEEVVEDTATVEETATKEDADEVQVEEAPEASAEEAPAAEETPAETEEVKAESEETPAESSDEKNEEGDSGEEEGKKDN